MQVDAPVDRAAQPPTAMPHSSTREDVLTAERLAAQAAHLTASVSKFAVLAKAELAQAARDDPKLQIGLPVAFGIVGCFLLLACFTFWRVRRRGGRKRPPRLDYEMKRLKPVRTRDGEC